MKDCDTCKNLIDKEAITCKWSEPCINHSLYEPMEKERIKKSLELEDNANSNNL